MQMKDLSSTEYSRRLRSIRNRFRDRPKSFQSTGKRRVPSAQGTNSVFSTSEPNLFPNPEVSLLKFLRIDKASVYFPIIPISPQEALINAEKHCIVANFIWEPFDSG